MNHKSSALHEKYIFTSLFLSFPKSFVDNKPQKCKICKIPTRTGNDNRFPGLFFSCNDLLVPLISFDDSSNKSQSLRDKGSLALRQLPDFRNPDNNRQSFVHDAACSAFSVFDTHSLRSLHPVSGTRRRSRAATMSHSSLSPMRHPHGARIRNILDSVAPADTASINPEVTDRLAVRLSDESLSFPKPAVWQLTKAPPSPRPARFPARPAACLTRRKGRS